MGWPLVFVTTGKFTSEVVAHSGFFHEGAQRVIAICQLNFISNSYRTSSSDRLVAIADDCSSMTYTLVDGNVIPWFYFFFCLMLLFIVLL